MVSHVAGWKAAWRCAHDVRQDQRRPDDHADRCVSEEADLDLADSGRGAATMIGLGVRHAIVDTMEDGLRSELQTLLDIETAMLETWFHVAAVERRVACQRRRPAATGLSDARRYSVQQRHARER